MSWTDEEIDNLFQESAKAQSFEYNNAYFSEVEAMLPVNKKGKDFLWMGTALLFIAVLTTGYFVNNNNDNTFGASNDQLANLELNTDVNTTNAQGTADAKTSNEGQESVTGESELIDQSSSADLTSTNSANLGSGNLNSINSATSQNAVGKKNGVNTSKSIGNGGQTWSSSKLIANGGSSLLSNGAKSPKGQLIDLRSETQIFEQKESRALPLPITASLGVNGANQLEQELDRSLTDNALSMPEFRELSPKAAFYVELNAGMSQSFLTSSADAPTSYGGGIGVESYLGKFNLTTGLNFKVSDHKELFLSREGIGKIYGFSSTPSVTNTYDFEQLYTFELPISLGYNFGKHNVNIGVRPSFSYGAKINEQEFVGEELTRSNKQSYLINQAVNRFGLKPTLGYSYHINKWTIGANIGVQLIETLDEGYFDGTINQFPIDGQIYFRRTIRLRK